MPDLKLPEVLDQRGAQKVAKVLVDLIGTPVTLDASDIRRLGTIGVEMLLAAQRQWHDDNVDLQVSNWSDDALRAIATLGLDPRFFQVEGSR